MRYLSIALSCALSFGCQGAGDSAGRPDLAALPEVGTSMAVAWTTSVVDIQTMNPLSGVNVCLAPANQVCALTNAAGRAVLPVPLNSQFMFSYSLANYATQFTEHTASTAADGNSYLLVSTAAESVLAAAVFKSLDHAKGNLVFSVIDASSMPLAGATISSTPSGGDGPYYFGSFGLPDSNAKSASSNGLGFLLNLVPGDYEVTAAVAGKTCAGPANKSWPGATAASVKARTMGGGITTVSIVCQ